MFYKMPAQSMACGRSSVPGNRGCIFFIFGTSSPFLFPSSLHIMVTNDGILKDYSKDHDWCEEGSPYTKAKNQQSAKIVLCL